MHLDTEINVNADESVMMIMIVIIIIMRALVNIFNAVEICSSVKCIQTYGGLY